MHTHSKRPKPFPLRLPRCTRGSGGWMQLQTEEEDLHLFHGRSSTKRTQQIFSVRKGVEKRPFLSFAMRTSCERRERGVGEEAEHFADSSQADWTRTTRHATTHLVRGYTTACLASYPPSSMAPPAPAPHIHADAYSFVRGGSGAERAFLHRREPFLFTASFLSLDMSRHCCGGKMKRGSAPLSR